MRISTLLMMFGLMTMLAVTVSGSRGYFAENCDEDCAESCDSGEGCCGAFGVCEGVCYCAEDDTMDQCTSCTAR